MQRKNHLYKRTMLILLLILSSSYSYGLNSDEAPRTILFFGRFHPLLLHLPIGALVVAFFIDIVGRIQKNYPASTIRNMLGFSAFFAIITGILGYFLSLEGGYHEQTLDLHFYTGILTALLTTILFLISRKATFKTNKIFQPLFVLSLISISVAGHFGSVLTHGDNFLTEYASPAKKEKTIEVVDSLRMYSDVVAKILDEKCLQCHNSNKRKGDLSLISKIDILKGGESGEVLLAGNAHKSLLFEQLLLPISDDDHMPPEGKGQLTKDEIHLLEQWINEGLDFENYVKNPENDTIKNLLKNYLVFDKIDIPIASRSDINDVKAAGFRVLELVPGKAELYVKQLEPNPTKKNIAKLSALKEQIVELDFGNTEVTDQMTGVIKKFKNLRMLRLNSLRITDKSIKNFKNLKRLEILNLYNTGISNQGLEELLSAIQPKQLYTWKTTVDRETATRLASEFDVRIQNNIQEGFVEMSMLEVPIIEPPNTLFVDSVNLKIESKLKNVELRYTLNGDVPDSTSQLFADKLVINSSKTLKIAAFKKGWLPSETVAIEYAKIKHKVPNFSIEDKPDVRYPNANKLFDLEEGSPSFKDGKWTGFLGFDVNTTIDLGIAKTVDNISINCLENVGNYILFPKGLIVYASNEKNGKFKKLGNIEITRKGEGGGLPELKKVTLKIPSTTARYFKVVVQNHKVLPKWHPGAGTASWMFVDEIYLW